MKQIALFFIWLALAGMAQAAPVYIGDNLRIGIRTEPGNQTAPIKIINSGTKLEPLETSGKYTRIRTSDGIEGWVRSSYLSETPPAKLLLSGMEAKYKAAQQELLSLQKKYSNTSHNSQALEQKLKQVDSELNKLNQQLSTLNPNGYRNWIYMLIGAVLLFGVAFLLGINSYKQQVAKKLGGQSL